MKIKLLFVIDYYKNSFAGTEGQLYKLADSLDKDRFDIHLLVFEESPWLKKNGFPGSYSVLGERSVKSPKTWIKLYREAKKLKKEGYHLAHVFFNDPSLICPPVFYANGIKTIISRRDMGYWYTPLMLFLLTKVRKWVSAVAVNSHAVKAVTVEKERYNDNQVQVIYNGYEMCEEVLPPASDLSALRQSREGVFLGLVANIREIKRISDAIEALALLGKPYRHVYLCVIGSGNPSKLIEKAKQLGVEDQLVFLGPREDVESCLQSIDIGMLCSESEGFSNAIVEYMKSGLPTICSNVGGNGEAITHKKTGLIYKVGDCRALAEAICTLVDNKEIRNDMGTAARKEAAERFSIAKMVSEYEELYCSTLGIR